ERRVVFGERAVPAHRLREVVEGGRGFGRGVGPGPAEDDQGRGPGPRPSGPEHLPEPPALRVEPGHPPAGEGGEEGPIAREAGGVFAEPTRQIAAVPADDAAGEAVR